MSKLRSRVSLLAVFLLLPSGLLCSEPWLKEGSFSASAGAGTQVLFEALDVYLEGEYIFWQTENRSLSFGAAVKAMMYTYETANFALVYRTFNLGFAALASVHLGLSGIGLPGWLDRLDPYLDIGACYIGALYSKEYSPSFGMSKYTGFSFAAAAGINWYFTRNLALQVEGYHYSYNGVLLGIKYRF